MRNLTKVLAVSVLAGLAVGCGLDPTKKSGSLAGPERAVGSALAAVTTTQQHTAAVETRDTHGLPTIRFVSGEQVRVVATLRNTGAAPLVLQFQDGQHFDIVITGPTGPVWRWSDGRSFTSTPGSTAIPQGGAYTFGSTWNGTDPNGQAATPGPYVVAVELRAVAPQPTPAFPLFRFDVEPQAPKVVTVRMETRDISGTPTTTFAEGAAITFRLVVVNPTSQDLVLQFPSAQRHAFRVIDGNGQTAFDSTRGKNYAMTAGAITVRAGGSMESRCEWNGGDVGNGALAPGTYRLEGEMTTATTIPTPAPITLTIRHRSDADIVAVYQVSGGLAGVNDTMTIRADRTAVRTTSSAIQPGPATVRTGRLNQADYESLIDLFNQSGWFGLPDRLYPAPGLQVQDAPWTAVTYQTGGQTKRIVSQPGAVEPTGYRAVRARLATIANVLE